jgi:phytoene dehydrogenase-like protein
VDGFRLDRGLQNVLSSYTELPRTFDISALQLRPLKKAVQIRLGERFYRLANPREEFWTALKSTTHPIGSVLDKLRLWQLERYAHKQGHEPNPRHDRQTTSEFLREFGFSASIIDRFFQPFFSAVFLERELKTSARYFLALFDLFAQGTPCLPAEGIQGLPDQLAGKLAPGTLHCLTRVRQIDHSDVLLETGERIPARAVVIATEEPAARMLLKEEIAEVPHSWSQTTTLYYASSQPLVGEAVFVLNATGKGPITAVCEVSAAAPTYAPPGQHLLAVSLVGIPSESDQDLDELVCQQLQEWYPHLPSRLRLLKVYRIPQALPLLEPGRLTVWNRPSRVKPGLYLAGDYRSQGSIQGALVSGRLAAEAVRTDHASA